MLTLLCYLSIPSLMWNNDAEKAKLEYKLKNSPKNRLIFLD